MNEYTFDIYIRNTDDVFRPVRTGIKIRGYSESEALRNADDHASCDWGDFEIRNLKLIKQFYNPDGEI